MQHCKYRNIQSWGPSMNEYECITIHHLSTSLVSACHGWILPTLGCFTCFTWGSWSANLLVDPCCPTVVWVELTWSSASSSLGSMVFALWNSISVSNCNAESLTEVAYVDECKLLSWIIFWTYSRSSFASLRYAGIISDSEILRGPESIQNW